MEAILTFVKSSDFARAVVFLLTALGVTVEPEHINAIVAGGLAFAGLIHTVRATVKAKK